MARELDELSRRYVELGFGIERHIEGTVDAYFGPPEIRDAAMAGPVPSTQDLLDRATSLLADVTAAGVDAYLTADLRHHPASEHIAADGPALLDAAHWATERPWLDDMAAFLRDRLEVAMVVSDLDTDPWTVHATKTSD